VEVEGKFYDGNSSREQVVVAKFTQERRFIIDELGIDEAISNIKIATRLGNTPRLIELKNGARFKTDDNDGVDLALKKLGIAVAPIHKIEKSWKLALSSIIVIALFITFMLTVGADYTANYIANRLPKSTLDSASKKTLEELDGRYLHKSNLSKEKREKIERLFKKLTNNDPHYKLHFRSSPAIGPNAFMLPSGDVVLIDELVFLDKDPNMYGILGVLAHEKGHYVYKHSLRGLIKTTVATAVVSYFTGDASFIVTTLPTVLITSKYSREFETQADQYAKSEMKRMGLSTKPLAKLFVNIENYYNKKYGDNNSSSSFSWISSHPVTSKRIEYFNKE